MADDKLPPAQQQPMPGHRRMNPVPDHGEDSYEGHGRLEGKKTVVTGADSGIGRAVAIAYAREGADVLISYLSEDEDAEETKRLVEEAGRKAVVVRGDLRDPEHCREVIDTAVEAFGRIDVLVSNAAYQASFARFEDITAEEWRKTFETNVDAFFHLVQAALPHMGEGGSIIGTSSINADQPSPGLLPYATTKGTIRDFVAGLGADARRTGHPGERRGARADLDAADPVHDAAREGRGLREEHAHRPPGTAEGAGACLCLPRIRRSELRHRRDHSGDRRAALHLIVSAHDAMKHQFEHEKASLRGHG
jgi:NAD(P)-dependent dehydrogenase (short-subunit alcohol dehydrogenase family)